MRDLRSVGRSATVAIVVAAAAAGCTGGAQTPDVPSEPTADRPPTQYIIGVDISGSRSSQELQDARALLRGLAGTLNHGDRVVFIETFRAGNDQAREWSDSLAMLKTPGKMTGGAKIKRSDFREDVADIATVFVDSIRSKSINTTDILSTVWRAADHAKAAGPRSTTLILMSDMLNATPELNMERPGGIPTAAWIAERRAQRRIPRLDGVCVIAVGAEMKSARGPQVQAFWDAYFRAAGSELPASRFRAMVADPAELRCTAADQT